MTSNAQTWLLRSPFSPCAKPRSKMFPIRLVSGELPVAPRMSLDFFFLRKWNSWNCVTPGSTVTYASRSLKSRIRFNRRKSRTAAALFAGTREPYPQFFPVLIGYKGTRYLLATRTHTWTCLRFPGFSMASTRPLVGNVAASASFTEAASVITNLLPSAFSQPARAFDKFRIRSSVGVRRDAWNCRLFASARNLSGFVSKSCRAVAYLWYQATAQWRISVDGARRAFLSYATFHWRFRF